MSDDIAAGRLYPPGPHDGVRRQHWVRRSDDFRVWTLASTGRGWTDDAGNLAWPDEAYKRGWRYVGPAIPPGQEGAGPAAIAERAIETMIAAETVQPFDHETAVLMEGMEMALYVLRVATGRKPPPGNPTPRPPRKRPGPGKRTETEGT